MYYPVLLEYEYYQPYVSEEEEAKICIQSYVNSEVLRLPKDDEGIFKEPGTDRSCTRFLGNAALLRGVRAHVREFGSTW